MIDKIFKSGVSIFFRNSLSFGVLGLILLSPLIVLDWFIRTQSPDSQQPMNLNPFDRLPFLSYPIFSLVLFFLLTGAVVSGTFQVLGGQKVRVGNSLRSGLSRLLPVSGVAIMSSAAAGLVPAIFVFAAIVLFPQDSELRRAVGIAGGVAGVFIFMRLWLAVPATIVERQGAFASMRRSAQLTAGYEGKIFGVLLLFTILFLVLMLFIFIGLILTAHVSASQGIAMTVLPVLAVIADVLGYVLYLLWVSCGSVLASVCYYELRLVREGADIDATAAVFE